MNKKTQVLTPEALGEMVYEVVNMTVPALLNPKMTASWEKGLDGITQGTVPMEDYREKLEEFIRKETVSMINENLTSQIAGQIRPLAGSNAKDMKARVKIGATCPVCGGEIETTPLVMAAQIIIKMAVAAVLLLVPSPEESLTMKK